MLGRFYLSEIHTFCNPPNPVTNLLDSGDHIHWTATFTPTSGFSGQAEVLVNDLSYSDLVGNQGSSGSDSVLLSPINYQDADTGWLMNYNSKAKSFDMKIKGGQATITQGGTIYCGWLW